MDVQQLMPYLLAANTAISLGAIFYTWLTAPSKRAQGDVDGLKIKLDEDKAAQNKSRQEQTDKLNSRFELVEARLVKIESDLTHLPNREQWHALQIAIERLTGRMETLDQRMTGRMDTLDERLKPVAATSARIQNYLMEQAGEK